MELQLVQVARLLGLEREGLTVERARAAIAADPGRFAEALFREAADSDDVTGVEPARAYLEGRLEELGPLFEARTAEAVRAAFERQLAAWG